jgi:hypothetical protein
MVPVSLMRRTMLMGVAMSVLFSLRSIADVAQKTIDKRNASESGEYAIGFSAKAAADGYDHAFIVWYYSDPKGNRTVRRGAGFYPVSSTTTKAYNLIFGITGKIFDDSKVKADRQLTVLVNKDIFDQALAVERDYTNEHTYYLGFDDCTTFVKNVATAIPGLKIPNRATHIYPSAFITGLYEDN